MKYTLLRYSFVLGINGRTILRRLTGKTNPRYRAEDMAIKYPIEDVASAFNVSEAGLNKLMVGTDILMTTKEAAEMLDLTPRTISTRCYMKFIDETRLSRYSRNSLSREHIRRFM